jgi:hypothetical protein
MNISIDTPQRLMELLGGVEAANLKAERKVYKTRK